MGAAHREARPNDPPPSGQQYVVGTMRAGASSHFRNCRGLSLSSHRIIPNTFVSSMHRSFGRAKGAQAAGNLHIDRRQGTVSYRTADCTSEGESGVKGETGELLSRGGGSSGGRSGGLDGGHCNGG
jgi:hypothetical protein